MPTEIIDLDEAVQKPKKVKLGGQIYTLPGELPAPLYLRLRAEEQAYAEQVEAGEANGDQRIEDLNDLLLDLFRTHQPDIEELPAGIVQLFTVIPRVYGAGSVVDDDEGGDDETPKPRKKTGARTGNASTRTQSKSRSAS